MEPLNLKPRDFVHLHLHSDYSLLQSTIQLKPLAGRLAELEMRACALTDYANLYGAVSFYNTMKGAGVRPIIGYEAMVATTSRLDRGTTIRSGELPYYHLVLLVKSFEGYQNLVHLASKAFTEGFHYKPRIDLEILAEKSSGLIALSGWANGSVGHALSRGDQESAVENARGLEEIFGAGNFYLEIQDHGSADDRALVKSTVELSQKCGIPLVATNDAHYLTADDARARDILVCIGEGRTLDVSRESSSEHYVRSADEMWQIFGGELSDSLTNTLRIAEQCELVLPLGDDNLTLPNFPIPVDSGVNSIDEYFQKVLDQGFEQRKSEVWLPMQAAGTLRYDLDAYRKRLAIEIETIKKMGFPGYFLIVWEFIAYARERGIPVGPGRGSAAGSLAAYCLRITDIDPLQYDLLFERFLNPERISMPDIDIDFCIRGRGAVIDHVTEVYGRGSVCQIVTFGTMASRAAIKDVGRALDMPYGDVEKIAKMIPPPERGRNVSISQALARVPELKKAVDTDPRVKDLVNVALKVEGCARHTSVHAAGVVISPKPLHELVPVAISAKNELTSQYPMGDLEKAGMLKMDFLGLTTLTIIADCLGSMKKRAGIEIDWTTIPLNDEKTMQLFCDGRTDAVFQFESSGMQEICRQLKPKELEDLSALNALYRPGPIDGGMIPDFIARHRGEKAVRYLVPQMKEILSNTFGVLVYQEQIMQLAQKLAGYSLGEADMMRRAMGKKKRDEMAKHEKKFIDGAVANGIKQAHAEEIFNLMSQFADYGFNRSHSIAYAYLAFQTAYLKAHYPSYFFSAVLSHEADDSAKVYKYSNELRSVGLELLPPDVNESGDGFTPLENAVRFGLSAIKGIGSATISGIIKAREAGPFRSITDMMTRLEQNAINRRGLESLICAGAFDSLNANGVSANHWRSTLFASVDHILQRAQRAWDDKMRGQNDLFGAGGQTNVAGDDLPVADPWTQSEITRQEKAALGFYLSVHPLDAHAEILSDLNINAIEDTASAAAGATATLAGIVSTVQVRFSKKGNRFCTFRLEDRSGGIKCIAWGDAFAKYAELLKDDSLLVVSGKLEAGEGQEATLIVSEAKNLDDAVPSRARAISIHLPDTAIDENYFDQLREILDRDPGLCDVYVNMSIGEVDVKILSMPLKIHGSRRLQSDLESKGCRVEWN